MVSYQSESSSDSDLERDARNSPTTEMDPVMLEEFRRVFANFKVDKPIQILENLDIDSVVKYIQSDKCKNIITLSGAGISTSAGIPDFRSPGSGIYHNLQRYNLPEPESLFDIEYFRRHPEPFYHFSKSSFSGCLKPTPCHYFIRLLNEKGLLLRHYTQNIDTLERVAELPEEKLVEAHGSFHSSHCIQCHKQHKIDWEKYFTECFETSGIPICTDCPGVIKPDIVFFGENLPDRFDECAREDFDHCDLLIIMGSSLKVQPFASLIHRVPASCPRLLINRERVGCARLLEFHPNIPDEAGNLYNPEYIPGLMFNSPNNVRDVEWIGDCDDGCRLLAEKLGWGEELKAVIQIEHQKIEMKSHMLAGHQAIPPVACLPHLSPTL